jgi:crotonobetainyl-CoA:carnitine CoA-transferase CaiB-like acyl-CoA transferase
MDHKPLEGIRVLDLTNVLAGPFCCHQLAHLGADVIKVEVPGRGDLARQLGVDEELNQRLMGISFLAQNPGKRSITLNLKKPEGKALLKQLVRSAQVVVENFRPGVMDRLGLGYEVLKRENSKLVYCAISGFGQDGPWRDLPAYDQIIQGLSGVMSITGSAETAPTRVGYPIADTIGGLTAAFAIAGALAGRDRNGGVFIDVSMLEATLATMGWVVSNYLIGGETPRPFGNENVTAAPSGTFRTADDPINIAANKQEQFEAVCRAIGRQDLIDDPRFQARDSRKANRAALKAEIEAALAAEPADHWMAELNRLGVPSGPVLSVPQILDHPQIRDRGLVADFEDVEGVDREIRVVRTGFKLSGQAPAVDRPPPRLGAHNREVYGELGVSTEELQRLNREGVI